MRRRLATTLLIALFGGCGADVDPPWQLDHERIIAVRSTPPRIATGESAAIDALLGFAGRPPLEADPAMATVVSPIALSASLSHSAATWTVTAPGEAQLAAARAELGLPAGDPVPLRLRVTFAETDKVGLKIVWLGEHADNPVLDPITVDGVDPDATSQIQVAPGVDVPLRVEFGDTFVVNWLTSCGTMHDFDLPHAYLRVEPEDDQAGTLGVVVRDTFGGVAWRLWPITAE